MASVAYTNLDDCADQMNKTRIAAIAALIVAVLAAGSIGAVSYADARADERRDLIRAHEQDMKDVAATASRDKAEAMAAALVAQKTRHERATRRLTKRLKAKSKQEARKAYEKGRAAGYSSGSTAGFTSGSVAGYEDGLVDASDELECSDDADVDWLPYCY